MSGREDEDALGGAGVGTAAPRCDGLMPPNTGHCVDGRATECSGAGALCSFFWAGRPVCTVFCGTWWPQASGCGPDLCPQQTTPWAPPPESLADLTPHLPAPGSCLQGVCSAVGGQKSALRRAQAAGGTQEVTPQGQEPPAPALLPRQPAGEASSLRALKTSLPCSRDCSFIIKTLCS